MIFPMSHLNQQDATALVENQIILNAKEWMIQFSCDSFVTKDFLYAKYSLIETDLAKKMQVGDPWRV